VGKLVPLASKLIGSIQERNDMGGMFSFTFAA
jgi:hypothetical protein